MAKTTAKNSFENFTNLYELSKTLRFELKPIEETKKLLKKTNLLGKTPIQVDQEIDELYHQEMKPMFDKLHEEFINEALGKVSFKVSDLKKLENLYLELRKLKKELKALRSNKDNKNESKIKGVEAEIKKIEGINKNNDKNTGKIKQFQNGLRENIVTQFNNLGEEWKKRYQKIKLNDKGYKILTNAKILEVLNILYPEKREAIKKFSGFFTYFSGFNKNRENYYSADDKATGVANRIINENFVKFLENKLSFEKISEKIKSLAEYKKFFKLENYQNCLTQEKIDDLNENIIGKINLEKNLFCQQENSKAENKNKKVFLPNLEKLQKQIGCRNKQQREQEEGGKSIYPKYLEKVGLGFHITKNFEGKYQIWECLDYLSKELEPKLKKVKRNYEQFFDNWQKEDYQLDKIWFRKESINTISGRWFGGNNWYILSSALSYLGTGKMEKGEYKIPDFVNLSELKEALDILEKGIDFDIKKSHGKLKKESFEFDKKFSYSAENLFRQEYKEQYKNKETLFETFLAVWKSEIDLKFTQIFDGCNVKGADGKDKFIPAFLKEFEKERQELFNRNKKVKEKSTHTETVKNLTEEGYLRLFQLTKYHNLEKKGEVVALSVENRFYDAFNDFWDENQIVIYHKAFQATLTQKPYSENKIKLNFECGTLLGGWSQTYESHGALIFQKDKKYYLGIINGTKFNDIEIKNLSENINLENKAKRLLYAAQKIDKKNPPRWFIRSKGSSFSPMVRDGLLNPEGILDIYDNKRYSKTENKESYKNYLPKLLDYFKEGFRKHKDFKIFKFDWFDSKEYDTVVDFYNHTADMCYKIDWENINFEALNKLVEQSRIYLFQIYNKDFELDENIGKNKYGKGFKSEKTIGKLNLHTKIFLELLKPENVKRLKLLGGGELFFRDISKEKSYKKDKKGEEVVNAKRYYEQKYFLHFPIQIKGRGLKGSFNQKVNQAIKNDQDNNMKIIGIDRGEKHLLYYSVTDSKGKMIEQGSLNEIQCGDKKVNYNEILSKRAGNMMEARKNWETIGSIKNFKEGYLSQAVHKIYQLILKYNAVVAMEDLNSEFKAKRTAKVEKSIYKKFELALAKKLNHLILKDKKADDFGGALKAYQLTPYIKPGDMSKFEKAKQWGILFYVRANYTSITDPLTGWRKHKYISNSETILKIQFFFSPDTGIQINYDQEKKCFKFSYENEGSLWKLFAFNGLQRFRWNNEKRKMETYNLYEKFEELFAGLDKSKNINQQIKSRDNFKWKNLIFWWNLLNQIRNSDKEKQGNENDFLQSPAWSEKYKCFYDSRKVVKNNIPNNGDANGAYNIARKGVMLLERIKKCQDISKFGNDNNGKNPENSYYISDKEWDKFVQQK